MKAAVYLGPENIEVQVLPDPECGADEVVIKVEVCSVCGTDIRIYNYGQANVVPPQVIGHEIAGTIEAVGNEVEGCEVGQRVTVATPVGCGDCKFCEKEMYNLCIDFTALGYHYPGGFAQYMLIPGTSIRQRSIIPLPDNVSFEHAALVEPLSCVVNGQEYLNIEEGDAVVVFGAGTIGCMQVELAKARGAGKIILIGRSKDRLELAERFGADVYLSVLDGAPVDRVIEETGGYGADVTICCCSDPNANLQAPQLTAKRGRMSYFAGLPKTDPTIEFDSNRLHYWEISLFGAFASNVRQYKEALELISSGKFDAEKFITSKFPLEGLEPSIRESKTVKGLKMLALPQL